MRKDPFDVRTMSTGSQDGSDACGDSVRRTEDIRFLTGNGAYVDDLNTPGAFHLVFVRSPHAHALIAHIDTAAAALSPGIQAVFTGQDLRDAGVGSIPCAWQIRDRMGNPMAEPPRYPLAVGKVRFVGEAVAVVVGDSANATRAAAELVSIDYHELPAVTSPVQACRPDAPLVWDAVDQNICCDWEIGDRALTDAAFGNAAHVVDIEITNNRLIPNALEPRAAAALYDPASGDHTLYTTSQNPHLVRSALSTVLSIPETHLRVISPDVGGGFGSKAPIYPEETVATWVAGRLRASVRWCADRSEAFLSDVHGRDHHSTAEMALAVDGRFLGLRVRTHANVGAYLTSGGTVIPSYYYAQLLAGPYATPAIYCNVLLCFTNTNSVDAYRGAGRPEATYLLERLIDKAAAETGIDRVELRRRNLIRKNQYPYKTPLGLEYDSGDHVGTLDIALRASEWNDFDQRRAASEARGRLRGIGMSTYLEVAGGTPSRMAGKMGARGGRSESAQIRVHPSGSVSVFSGVHSHGQGHETTFAQLVSERLGIPIEDVRIIQGDTDRGPFGRGTIASRSLVIGGSAIVQGVGRIIVKATRIAAHLLEAEYTDVHFENGMFKVAGKNRTLSFGDIARAAYAAHDFPVDQLEPGLEETVFYDPPNWSFPGGCHICELEIDPETGKVEILQVVAVDDLGRIINPMIVHGQLHGGLAQGIGQALFEGCVYDETGQLLSGTFMDYRMPRAADFPGFTVLTHGTDCATNPLKAKGCGEVGSVGVPPAVINALLDALRGLGVRDIAMPATPFAIWQAIQRAGDRTPR